MLVYVPRDGAALLSSSLSSIFSISTISSASLSSSSVIVLSFGFSASASSSSSFLNGWNADSRKPGLMKNETIK